MIQLTDNAVAQVKSIKIKDNKPNHALRVSVTDGGCSGMSYQLDFDDQISEKDKIFEFGDVKVVVDPKTYIFVRGMILDFSSGLDGKGFEFNNPNAKTKCGCGSSFSA